METIIQEIQNKDNIRKSNFIKIVAYLSVSMLSIFVVLNILITHRYLLATIESIIILSMLFILFLLKKNLTKASTLFSLSIVLAITSITAIAPFQNYSFIWTLFVPITTFFLLGIKRAFIFSVLFFTYLVAYIYYHNPETVVAANMLFSYIAITFILYLYEKSRAVSDNDNSALLIKLQKSNKELHKLSTTDSLTQLYNRNKIDKLFKTELQRSQRYQIPMSLLLIDIDHFKYVNDTYGHQTGDTILQEFSQILQSNSRESDYISRWGGEEFLILLTSTSLQDADTFAKKLCKTVESSKFSCKFSNTCSIGISSFESKDSEEMLLERADKALYKAKGSGRNRVVTQESL